MLGVNLASASFGAANKYGQDYIYPDASDFDYFKSKGIDLIRLPFKWERLQPDLGGPLDEAELLRIKGVLADAQARGIEIILDVHNFGRYKGQIIGSPAVSISAFADFWAKFAAAVNSFPNIWGFDLMNEPHDMGNTTIWPAAAQAAVDAIRSTDVHHTIIVEGDGWSGGSNWQVYNANLRINDPANKVIYDAHVYFDADASGTYSKGYDQDGAYPDIGVDRLRPLTAWLEENNALGFIGEFDVPDNDARWLTVLDRFLSAMSTSNLSGAYWAAGPWWGDYPFSIFATTSMFSKQVRIRTRTTTRSAGVRDAIPTSGFLPVSILQPKPVRRPQGEKRQINNTEMS